MPFKEKMFTLARCSIIIILLGSFFIPSHAVAQSNVSAVMAPQNVNASPDVEKKEVVISWPHAGGAAAYNVYRKLSSEINFTKLTFSPIKVNTYTDAAVTAGRSYDYIVRSVDAAGNESADSHIVGAPNMVMDQSVQILHQGQVVDVALPGDAITYIIDYTNNGFGDAKDVSIVHAIPRGTTIIAGTAGSNSPKKVKITYFDVKKDAWVEKIENEADITKVNFEVLDDIAPVSAGKSGSVSFKVSVN